MQPHTNTVPSASSKRVMVVDDNEMLLRAWNRVLEKQDCVAYVTPSPEEALSYLQNNVVDLLIADIVMPDMDGIELMQKAKEISPNTRIILTTAYACDFSRIRLKVETPDLHILLKPYNNLHEVQKFLGRVLHDDDSLDTEDSFKNKEDVRIHLWNL